MINNQVKVDSLASQDVHGLLVLELVQQLFDDVKS